MSSPTTEPPGEVQCASSPSDCAGACALLGNAAELVAQVRVAVTGGELWNDLASVVLAAERLRSTLDALVVSTTEVLCMTREVEAGGWSSTKDFLTAVTGGGKGAGPALVRLSERLAELPATAGLLATGELSRAKAELIATKVASLPFHEGLRTAAEAALLELAAVSDATDMARSWPAVVKQIDPEGALLGSLESLDKQEQAAHHARHLSLVADTLGGVRIRGYCTVEDAELVRTTLMPLAAPRPTEPGACGGVADAAHADRGSCPDPRCDHSGRDPRDHGARLLDALVEACHLVQTSPRMPESHGAVPRLAVTMQLDQLSQRLAEEHDPGVLLGSGERLSAAAARRLACDAEIIPAVLGTRSQVLDVGHTARLVTAAIWTALVLRDRHCAFPGCGRLPVACDAHHVVHWADGGATSLANLVLLCRRHHVLVHCSPWQVRIGDTDQRPEFLPPTGRRRDEWVRQRRPREPDDMEAA